MVRRWGLQEGLRHARHRWAAKGRGYRGYGGTEKTQSSIAPFAQPGLGKQGKGVVSAPLTSLAVKIPAWCRKGPGDLGTELQLISVGIAWLNPPALDETSASGRLEQRLAPLAS